MQIVLNILVLGSIYSLISCGYVIIYKVSRVLNLAHGELMMVGAYLLLTTASAGWLGSPLAAIGLALVLSLTVGILVYVLLMRRMTGESVLAAVLTTIALGILIRGAVVLLWSAQHHYPATKLHIANPSIELFQNAKLSLISLILIGVTVATYAALFAFMRFGRWGLRMRATGQNALLAAQRGVNLHAVYALAWGISTFTGAVAGMLIALDSGLDSTIVMIGLKAFPAALVGGLDSLAGAIIGSIIISASEVILIQHFNPLLSDAVPFLILIAMLVIRPWGLFGTREELDRV
ncbi:MAG: branched-chain amino acid ABC transporter permease [Xanthobacteraceae bacterium]|nr:MAG: branched-chain amino acid ABC transporter permease [Xanthobacteraceae bacterium]